MKARLIQLTFLSILALFSPLAIREARAQEEVVPLDGTHFFRNLLHIHNLEPVKSIAAVRELQEEETLIVIFGDLGWVGNLEKDLRLRKFVRDGGALLVASDRADFGAFQEFGLSFVEDPLRNQAYLCLRGKTDCPFFTNIDKEHPIFKGVTKPIATNHPGQFEFAFHSKNKVLALVERRRTQPDPERMRQPFRYHPCVISSSTRNFGDERVLFINGHGIFMNQMAALDEIDNSRFATNCVKWLTNDGRRKYVLFVEEGRVKSELNVGLTEPPLQITPAMIDPLLVILERQLSGWEREGFFDRLAQSLLTPTKLLQYLLVAFCTFLVVRGFRRLLVGKYRRESSLPLVSRSLEKTTRDVPTVHQREQQALQESNMTEYARTLVRHWFESHSLHNADRPPQVAESVKRTRRHWQAQINSLWQLGFGRRPLSFSSRQLRELYELLQSLQHHCVRGELRFEAET